MTDALAGLVQILAAVLPAFAYFLLVGLAVRGLVPRVKFPAGLAISAALGLAVSSFVVTVGYVLFGVLSVVVWGLAAVSVLIVGFTLTRQPLRMQRRALADPADLVGLVAALLVLAPLLSYGRQFWTLGTNDFPHYAASVQVWLGNVGEGPGFVERHPDPWGPNMHDRASFEKPVMTGLMVIVQTVSQVPADEWGPPLTMLATFILAASLALLVRRQFHLSAWWSAFCVLPPVFALDSISRAYHAQLGQTMAMALLAAFLAAVPVLLRARSGSRTLAAALVLATLLAAGIGCNASLVLGAAPTIAALSLLRVLWERPQIGTALGRLLLLCVFTLVWSLPLYQLYLRSLDHQGTGLVGYDIAFASPLSLFGISPPPHWQFDVESLDPSRHLADNGPALIGWAVAGVLLLVWAVVLVVRQRRDAVLPILIVTVIVANGVALYALFGLDSYNANKWGALVGPICGALLLGVLLSVRRRPLRWAGRGFAVGCTAFSVTLAMLLGSQLPMVVTADAYALRNSAELGQVDVLNVDVSKELPGQLPESLMLSLVAPSAEVNLLSGYDYLPAPPIGHTFLVDTFGPGPQRAGQIVDQTPLNDGYELQERYAPLPWGSTEMGLSDPLWSGHLYGIWQQPEEGGVWTASEEQSWLVFDVPPGAGDVEVTLTGRRNVADGHARVRVYSGDREVADHAFRVNGEAADLTFVLTRADLPDGQATLRIEVPELNRYGRDTRDLGYFLGSIRLMPSGGDLRTSETGINPPFDPTAPPAPPAPPVAPAPVAPPG